MPKPVVIFPSIQTTDARNIAARMRVFTFDGLIDAGVSAITPGRYLSHMLLVRDAPRGAAVPPGAGSPR